MKNEKREAGRIVGGCMLIVLHQVLWWTRYPAPVGAQFIWLCPATLFHRRRKTQHLERKRASETAQPYKNPYNFSGVGLEPRRTMVVNWHCFNFKSLFKFPIWSRSERRRKMQICCNIGIKQSGQLRGTRANNRLVSKINVHWKTWLLITDTVVSRG